MYKTVIYNECARPRTTTDNNIQLLVKKKIPPDYDTVDVETCLVHSQPTCVLSDDTQ
jgi:hypothetical protein